MAFLSQFPPHSVPPSIFPKKKKKSKAYQHFTEIKISQEIFKI